MIPLSLIIWFGLSVLTEVVSGLVLWLWLRQKGAPLTFGLGGLPGYLERAYWNWCKANGLNGRPILVFRIVSKINMVAAILFNLPYLIMRH